MSTLGIVEPAQLDDRAWRAVGGRMHAEPVKSDPAPSRTVEAGPQHGAQERGSSSTGPEEALRAARTDALIRHAKAVDRIFEVQHQGGIASPDQRTELNNARDAFEKVRPHGCRDAEAAYLKDPELAFEASGGGIRRAVQALQLEKELRISPERRADQFVARWQKLKQESERQYRDGEYSAHRSTRRAMADMAKGLKRDPQLESILASRKQQLGIPFETGRCLGAELAFTHGIDLGRGRGIGI